jgi:hypothetical protein
VMGQAPPHLGVSLSSASESGLAPPAPRPLLSLELEKNAEAGEGSSILLSEFFERGYEDNTCCDEHET